MGTIPNGYGERMKKVIVCDSEADANYELEQLRKFEPLTAVVDIKFSAFAEGHGDNFGYKIMIVYEESE